MRQVIDGERRLVAVTGPRGHIAPQHSGVQYQGVDPATIQALPEIVYESAHAVERGEIQREHLCRGELLRRPTARTHDQSRGGLCEHLPRGKAAIYRRYRSKAELLLGSTAYATPGPTPDTGTLRGDLLALATSIRDDMSAPVTREVTAHVVVEIGESPALADRLHEAFVVGEIDEVRAVLERAVERGELHDLPDVTAIHRLLGGALFYAIYVVGDIPGDAQLASIADLITAGCVTCGAPGRH
ncbi:TetR-like C-terminal domain-containing protein [Microbacterium sp.]|uniref:TetR-like C-terminal domain-containing protein n=1 Tax=Microbacterium sp. TaxID=51671 RepID=UPI003A855493